MYERGSAVAQSPAISPKGAIDEQGNATAETHRDNLQGPAGPGMVGGARSPDSRDRQGELGSLSSGIGRHGGRDNYAAEREELAGPDYCPKTPGVYKWAGQPGSVFIGDQRVPVIHPRLREPHGEIAIPTYGKLRERRAFSEELLGKALRGLSAQKYQETVVEAAQAFGVSPTAVSKHVIEATTQKLKTLIYFFQERLNYLS